MAKHIVKCFFCGVQFDASIEPFIKVNSVRYAHKNCYENHEKLKIKEETDKNNLEEYICELFKIDCLSPRIRKQINDFKKQYNFTYSGMLKTLKYFFEIKNNSIEKANGGIGIIPYVYEEAYKYYSNLQMIQNKNKEKNINNYKPKIFTVKIPPPKRKTKKHKIFNFLDEEEELNEQ